MNLKFHPLAEIFPLMTGAEFDALVADIRDHGLREPVVLHEGAILDGRNRYRACTEAGVMPVFEDWHQDGDPQTYVISKNLHRRHLNESQRAMIAATLANRPHGDQRDVEIRTSLSAQGAAELLNVSRDTVFNAKTVQREGTPEEIEAVERGEASVSTIAKQIRAKAPTETRKKQTASLTQVGKNPERIQRQQINAEIWGRVRDALTHLTSLPLPVDAVAIVRAHDKAGLVDARLADAMKWLGDFSHAWNSSNQDAA